MNSRSNPVFRSFSIVFVSIYLAAIGTYLILRKRIHPSISFFALVKSYFRSPYQGTLSQIVHESQNCYTASLPNYLISDKEGASKIVLFENDVPLIDAHMSHEDIRRKGEGRYSHWGPDIYFSSSDNSNPITNGRDYSVKEMKLSEFTELKDARDWKRKAA